MGNKFTSFNPPDNGTTARGYSHGVLIPSGASLLYISGQVGTDAQGNTPEDFSVQARNALNNFLSVLRAASPAGCRPSRASPPAARASAAAAP